MKIQIAVAALLCLFASDAFAAGSVLSISEYSTMASTDTGGAAGQMAAEPAITDQPLVDFSGGVASSAAFSSRTRFIRVSCSVRCAIKFGIIGSTTATTANKPLGVDSAEYFGVLPGNVVSVIAAP